jgi:hypothetical protein
MSMAGIISTDPAADGSTPAPLSKNAVTIQATALYVFWVTLKISDWW